MQNKKANVYALVLQSRKVNGDLKQKKQGQSKWGVFIKNLTGWIYPFTFRSAEYNILLPL